MRASLIVPMAGLFRHNEVLLAGLAAAQECFPFELVIPTIGGPSPRLHSRLAQLGLAHRIVTIEGGMVGALLHAGVLASRGQWCVWLHDDARPENVQRFLEEMTQAPFTVPLIPNSHNADQDAYAPPRMGVTTRPIDRAAFSFRRKDYARLGLDVSPFNIEGYQVAIQTALAAEGYAAKVAPVRVEHFGGETLSGLAGVDFKEALEADMERAAGTAGVHVEHHQRPAVPRIIAKNSAPAPVPVLSDDPGRALEEINTWAAVSFEWQGETWRRVTLGDHYSIPPLMEWYDVALVAQMGYGDALMHTSAPWHFKALYPWVKFRCWTYAHAAVVAERSAAWDEVVALKHGEYFPAKARVWNVANGLEGTPVYGFRNLGIEHLVPYEMRRMAPYTPRPVEDAPVIEGERPIGIQLNGGWNHKRYAHVSELAEMFSALGFTPYFFGTVPDEPQGGRRVHTPTWDHFALGLAQLTAWVGFDSGASYLANVMGVPSVWLFASHNPAGLIGASGAGTPYRTIWPGLPRTCACTHRATCRPGLGGAFFEWGQCGRRGPHGPGADCLDEVQPSRIVQETLNLLEEVAV